jgi:hypothetical protein
MTATGVRTPYRSDRPAGRDGFGQLLLAEWTKFRTVRGWLIGLIAVAVLTALATVALAGTANAGGNSLPDLATGPSGTAVTDSFYFVHQTLDGNGSITASVTSLTGLEQQVLVGPPGAGGVQQGSQHVVQPWAKAGIIIKESTRPGSAYAAMMVTGGHGIRMQYDFTHDTAGLPGLVSATSPRWLRLTRSGDIVTGYDSADGTHWTQIGTASLAGLPATVQVGLFVASPQDQVAIGGMAGDDSAILPTVATAVFSHVGLRGGRPGASWSGEQIQPNLGNGGGLRCLPSGCIKGSQPEPGTGLRESAGTFTVTGDGDIAPYVPIVDPIGVVFKGTLVGLLAVIALAALFITAEYRRGMIRTTFAASPRRGRVLVAKAIVIGAVAFVAGLIGAAVAFPIAEDKLRAEGWLTSLYPVRSLFSGPGLQIVVGTAALFAVAAVLALAAGAVLRRSAGAIAAVIGILIVPLILSTVLPLAPAQWLQRLTPAAAFGLQQGNTHYSQVSSFCTPYHGCYSMPPWDGFAVLCAWAVAALGLAVLVLRRRDI